MVILFGGSFNPPTIAHYKIAEYLIRKYKPNHFIFIPVGNNYNKPELIPFKYRYEMVEIFAKQLKKSKVSDYEAHFKKFSGTIDTLSYFQQQYPNEEIYYVIGADNLLTFQQWIDADNLLKDYQFIVINRNQIDLEKIIAQNELLHKYQENIIIETEFEMINVSSTQYRSNRDEKIVTDEINQYIDYHKLYH